MFKKKQKTDHLLSSLISILLRYFHDTVSDDVAGLRVVSCSAGACPKQHHTRINSRVRATTSILVPSFRWELPNPWTGSRAWCQRLWRQRRSSLQKNAASHCINKGWHCRRRWRGDGAEGAAAAAALHTIESITWKMSQPQRWNSYSQLCWSWKKKWRHPRVTQGSVSPVCSVQRVSVLLSFIPTAGWREKRVLVSFNRAVKCHWQSKKRLTCSQFEAAQRKINLEMTLV